VTVSQRDEAMYASGTMSAASFHPLSSNGPTNSSEPRTRRSPTTIPGQAIHGVSGAVRRGPPRTRVVGLLVEKEDRGATGGEDRAGDSTTDCRSARWSASES